MTHAHALSGLLRIRIYCLLPAAVCPPESGERRPMGPRSWQGLEASLDYQPRLPTRAGNAHGWFGLEGPAPRERETSLCLCLCVRLCALAWLDRGQLDRKRHATCSHDTFGTPPPDMHARHRLGHRSSTQSDSRLGRVGARGSPRRHASEFSPVV